MARKEMKLLAGTESPVMAPTRPSDLCDRPGCWVASGSIVIGRACHRPELPARQGPAPFPDRRAPARLFGAGAAGSAGWLALPVLAYADSRAELVLGGPRALPVPAQHRWSTSASRRGIPTQVQRLSPAGGRGRGCRPRRAGAARCCRPLPVRLRRPPFRCVPARG